MGRPHIAGFVFSLDAFIAFSLILMAIQTLLVLSATPHGYYRGLLQADFLAQDTLQTLAIAQFQPGQSFLESASSTVISGGTFGSSYPIVKATDSLIPSPYSYAYFFYDFNRHAWFPLYNASADSLNPHHDVAFHRVQAVSQTLVMGRPSDAPLVAGQSPYCNVVCKGWGRTNNNGLGGNTVPPSACQQVPCDVSTGSTYDPGDFNVGVLRLVVWG